MATYYVNGSTGDDATTDATSDDGAYETIQGAFDDLAEADPEGGAAFSGGDIISIADGTYTELVEPTKPWIVKSTSGNATGVIITSSGAGRTFEVGSAASGVVLQDLTINYTHAKSSSRGALICSSAPMVTVQRCIIGSTSYGVYYPGTNSVFDRCKIMHIPGATSTYNYGIRSTRSMTVTACLFFNWLKYSVYADQGAAGQVIKNCTVIVASGFDVNGGIWLNGDGSGGPSLSNTIIYNAGTMDYGVRVAATADVCVLKNNLVYNDGGTMTVTNEYFRTDSSTTADNWSTDHSSETEADYTVDSGEDIFDNYAGGDYHPNADGSAQAGNGIAALAATYDYAGDEFASPPAIGCYAEASSGWAAGTTVGPVAVGSVTSVGGVAKGSISKIIGV